MRELHIDIETYSSADLLKCGVYRYVQAPDFTVLLIAYAFDDGPVHIIDCTKEEELQQVDDFCELLTDPTIVKVAFNAAFERACLSAFYALRLEPEQWRCTMVKSAMAGYPGSLDQVAASLRLPVKKDPAGKALIRYFSLPCKPTKSNGMRSRNLPQHDLFKWQEFKDYCVQDVVVERAIESRLSWFTIPDAEQRLWTLDQQINDRGVRVDRTFVGKAMQVDVAFREELEAEALQLTGLDNPNSTAQLKEWLSTEMGSDVQSLNKTAMPALMQQVDSDAVARVLQIRAELSKTSVKKYEAIANAVCNDGRVRGLLQYYGASRSGRWAGRLVQVQNLPQNHLRDLDLARDIVASGDAEIVRMLFGNVGDVLSQLIRTAFTASADHRLVVADFSAIEARVIAWLAGEQWRLDVFNGHGKIYEASAAQMFNVPIESVTKGSDLRQKGKVAELALGYQGGPGALAKMGAERMGLSRPEQERIVKLWRSSNPRIVKLWGDVERAAVAAVEEGMASTLQHGLRFQYQAGRLIITLPSGRQMIYPEAQVLEGKLTYYGQEQTTRRWARIDTYGGKLVENIIQAIARDCLAHSMLSVNEAGFDIVMHVHDEIVCDVHSSDDALSRITSLMGQPIPWAKGLPLRADGYETYYYKKD